MRVATPAATALSKGSNCCETPEPVSACGVRPPARRSGAQRPDLTSPKRRQRRPSSSANWQRHHSASRITQPYEALVDRRTTAALPRDHVTSPTESRDPCP